MSNSNMQLNADLSSSVSNETTLLTFENITSSNIEQPISYLYKYKEIPNNELENDDVEYIFNTVPIQTEPQPCVCLPSSSDNTEVHQITKVQCTNLNDTEKEEAKKKMKDLLQNWDLIHLYEQFIGMYKLLCIHKHIIYLYIIYIFL